MGGSLGNNGGRIYSYAGQPVLIDCNFVVTPTNGLGITALKGQGVENVFMHTSTTPSRGPNGYLNPNPAVGLAWVQLSSNYNRYLGAFSGSISPVTGSGINIDSVSAALTIGQPYVISSVGHAAAGTCTVAPVADVAGSLASSYFVLYDAYGNTWIIWNSVSGVGAKPNLGVAAADGVPGLHYVQLSFLASATAAQIGAALVLVVNNLPSGIAGVFSFTSSGTTTVTIVNTNTNPYNLPGIPQDGLVPTGFTFALTVNDFNYNDWVGVGLPPGLVPAVGQSFIAKATGSGKSTGQVKAVSVSGVRAVEVIGDPNLSFGPQAVGGSPNVGGWVLVQFPGATSASVTTLIPTAPATGSVVYLSFYVDQRFTPSNIGL